MNTTHTWAAGSGDPLAEADAAAAAAEADGAEDGAAAADGGEVAEKFNPDEWELTPKGLAKALAFRGGVPDRRGRRPTREEKGSYIDNADLDAEVRIQRYHEDRRSAVLLFSN